MGLKVWLEDLAETLAWLGPRVGFVMILGAVGYAMAGGSGQKVALFAAFGLISFALGYLMSMFFNLE
ncbi:MAG TPA: hypothetical protein PKX93_07880 [bacterium]|nr:hypothetical protein [bacterium]HOL67357.1 hypothetical protein [bacterium]HPP11802.1 hypothetical protein [bacterium]